MTALDIVEGGYFEAAVMLMDTEIREMVHDDLAPCTNLEFMEEYMKRHVEKYGVEFIV